MPSAARAIDTLVIAHPSPHIVERSPGPSTPIGSLAHDASHCVYVGGDGKNEDRMVIGAASTQQRIIAKRKQTTRCISPEKKIRNGTKKFS
jgi:hypothetical protein